MPNTVEVTFQIDQSGAGRAVLRQIDQDMHKIGGTAKQTGGTIDSAFAVFKGTLIAQYFQQGVQAAIAFGTSAVAEINKLKAAQLGLASIAAFKGLSRDAAGEAVANLDIVKSGLISVGDASEAMKNFLKTGFNLQQATALVQRFGDTAAFGRTASLSFGDAVRSGSEGVAIQSSQLLNNVGIVENLATLMQRHGMVLDDLTDKTKGSAATTALFGELMGVSAGSVGNASTLTGTFAGKMAQAESAQTKFMQAVGESIITNKAFNEGLASVVTFIGQLTAQLNDPKSDLSKMFSTAVSEAGELVKLTTKIGTALSEWKVPAAVSLALKAGLAVVNPGAIIDFGREDIEAAGEKTHAEFLKRQADYKTEQDALGKVAAKQKELADAMKETARVAAASHVNIIGGGSFSVAQTAQSPLKDQFAALAKLNAEVNADNPFVTLYAQGRLAQDEMWKSSKGFTDDFRKRLMEVQAEAFKLKDFALQATNAVAAAGLRASASQLAGDRSFEGKVSERAVSNIGMLAEAKALRGGFDVNAAQLLISQIKSVQGSEMDALAQAQKIEQLTSGLDRGQLGRGRGSLAETRANALSTIAETPFVDFALQAAQEQFSAIERLRGTGTAGEEAIRRSQFLSVAGGLQANQMDAGLRQEVVAAKLDEAKSLETARQKQAEIYDKLLALLEQLAGNPPQVEVKLIDDSRGAMAATVEDMGRTPNFNAVQGWVR